MATTKKTKVAKIHYHPAKKAPLAYCGACTDAQHVTSEKEKVTCLRCRKMGYIH